MTVSQFLDVVRKSQLAPERQLKEFLGPNIATSAPAGDDVEALAADMVRANLLTQWQAAKLLAGKFKGFFLDQYELRDHLGKHETGQRYLGFHRFLKRYVEIWILPPTRIDDSAFCESFRTQVRLAAAHAGVPILQDYNCDASGHTYYIVMERKAS